uniref:Uncharacterized protein n=1 Tax=Lotus japonicus TaxID=34305 RepID=I3S9U8_LOTJA|nr:unknown [Lotus japonicus]
MMTLALGLPKRLSRFTSSCCLNSPAISSPSSPISPSSPSSRGNTLRALLMLFAPGFSRCMQIKSFLHFIFWTVL